MNLPTIFKQRFFVPSLLMLALFLSITACQEKSSGLDEGKYVIQGEVNGVLNGIRVYLYDVNTSGQVTPIDTTMVTNEQFVFDGLDSVSFPDLQMITIDGVQGNLFFLKENSLLEIEAYKDSLDKSYVKGGPQNDIFATYNKQLQTIGKAINSLNDERRLALQKQERDRANQIAQQVAAKQSELINYNLQFAKDNPNSALSVVLLRNLLAQKQKTASEIKPVFDALSDFIKTSPNGKFVDDMMANAQKTDIGGQAPEFAAPDQFGNILSLKDAMGKYTLIDFWASWCKPCRIENPNVVRVYNKYHDKGLNIISVSLDRPNQQELWKKAIVDDNMDWYHVSNLKFWQEPIAQLYGVKSIPATFLIDENGVIVAKNLRGQALENKIKELLGDS